MIKTQELEKGKWYKITDTSEDNLVWYFQILSEPYRIPGYDFYFVETNFFTKNYFDFQGCASNPELYGNEIEEISETTWNEMLYSTCEEIRNI